MIHNSVYSIGGALPCLLRAAECTVDTPALPRQDNHHDLVTKAMELIAAEEGSVGGQLGRPSGGRFRSYERLKRYAEQVKGTLFESQELLRAIDDVYRCSRPRRIPSTGSCAAAFPTRTWPIWSSPCAARTACA